MLRDRRAYSILATWIGAGVLDAAAMSALGDEMADRFADPEIQARTFAPLILDSIVSAGGFNPRWVEAFTQWYPHETDLRGHDPRLGWLHAVAHGADLLATFGRCPQVAPEEMLALAALRLLTRTDHVLRDQEEDRLAHAMALTLTRPELSVDSAVGWLSPIKDDFAAGVPGPIPPYASNTMRTLRVLYVLADRGVRPGWRSGSPTAIPNRTIIKDQLAAVLALIAPITG